MQASRTPRTYIHTIHTYQRRSYIPYQLTYIHAIPYQHTYRQTYIPPSIPPCLPACHTAITTSSNKVHTHLTLSLLPPPRSCPSLCIHVHTYLTYIHTYKHSCINTYIPTYIHKIHIWYVLTFYFWLLYLRRSPYYTLAAQPQPHAVLHCK